MRKQVIRTAPSRVKVGTYLTKKGQRLKSEGASEEVLAKYTKNRYKPNPESKPFKTMRIVNDKPRFDTKRIIHVPKVEVEEDEQAKDEPQIS
jgi:hypothetical protein